MSKRLISENHFNRLKAQHDEAKILKLTKIANSLSTQLANVEKIRDDDSSYIYSESDMKNDVNNALWTAIVRISDYLGQVPDAKQVQEAIEKCANELFHEVCVMTNTPDGVGAYEPNVPGEARENVAFEVKETE